MENKAKKIRQIAMVSTHGFFDPVPQLGQTDTGGQVVYVLELAKAMVKAGIKTDIYTRWFDRTKPQVDPVPGCPDVRVIRIPGGKWEFLPKEVIYDVLPELEKNLHYFIREHKLDYDLFHGHYVDGGMVAVELARQTKKPSFFTAHSLGAWKREQMGGDQAEMEKKFNFEHRIREELKIFNEVNAQTVTSDVQAEKIRELYDFHKDNIGIIPPGVNTDIYFPSDEKVTLSLPDNYIYCLSRIDSNKGFDFLLHAFSLVTKKHPDVHLVIGGGSPDPKPRELEVFQMIRNIVFEKEIANRVHIIGYVPDELMAAYYRQAILFVMPSLFEPFGMTSQEAMACGTPVIASKYGGIRNIIVNHENSILVDSRNTEEFANEIMQMLDNPVKRKAIGKKAYQTIIEGYSWEAIARKFLDFYNQYIHD